MDRKEKVLGFIRDTKHTPLRIEELMAVLEVPESDREQLQEILRQLIQEDKISLTKRKRYQYNENAALLQAKFIGHDKGFGFAELPGEAMDLFIPSMHTNGAMHGDTVLVRVLRQASGERRAEGEVVEISERANKQVVGTFQKRKDFGFVISDDRKMNVDIYIPSHGINNARNGQKVVCRLTSYGGKGKKPEGKIIRVIGYPDEPGNDILSVILQYGLSEQFSPKVLEEAKKEAVLSPSAYEGRLDLRDELLITIDGEDAKDLDDAVSLKKLENGDWLLGVHIADVSHYVREGSELDKEAFLRGTSVYLPDRVIPMLPKELSNGICSLNPREDRLALSTLMTVSPQGKVKDTEIRTSVIRTSYRMTYTEVTAILEGAEMGQYEQVIPMLFEMEKLAILLRQRRQKRGSLDFQFPECKIILDENNRAIDVKPYETGVSNYIIEEFMLLTNETIAELVFWQSVPFVYRIHEEPDREKMQHFFLLAKNLGYRVKMPKEIKSGVLLEILEACRGTEEEKILSTVMLRSMMKAKYSPENKGHYGLAASYYCHFTSPIRRYPDLMIHRILKKLLAGELTREEQMRYIPLCENAALQSSEREVLADSAERDCEDIKKAEYMQQFIGEERDAVISSVTGFGIFAELPNTVEGLIRYADIQGDYFEYNESNFTAVGRRTGKRFAIGDKVRIRVAAASPAQRTVDFELL